jgi:predicted RNA-binding Zn-ribbon protein involved in translation (DUF1610 family)
MDDLDRLFHRLVHNIRGKNPAHLSLPFTVAELYEQLVPYRHNRRELGIETNQDYEIAVTRLLSGERGYLLSDAAIQESLQKELGGSAPDTGAFREYATAEVSIAPAALDKVGAAQADGSRAAAAAESAAPPREPAAAQSRAAEQQPPPAESPAGATESPAAATRPAAAPPPPEAGLGFDEFSLPEGCRFCGATLPEGRHVKFCPNCGQDLTVSRCPACGSEIEAGWRFCITCGRPTG